AEPSQDARGPAHPLHHEKRKLLPERDADSERAAPGAPEAHSFAPPRQSRLPEGSPQPRVRRRRGDHGHAESAGCREPRHGDGTQERGGSVTTRVAAIPGPLTVSDILARRARTGLPPRGLMAIVSVLS